jgi:hypothetical protein
MRFLPIFGEKIGVFLKNLCYDQLFSKFSFVLSQKRRFFRKMFRRKYLKNHNIGPRPETVPPSVVSSSLAMRPRATEPSETGLPDGMLSNQKSKFG